MRNAQYNLTGIRINTTSPAYRAGAEAGRQYTIAMRTHKIAGSSAPIPQNPHKGSARKEWFDGWNFGLVK